MLPMGKIKRKVLIRTHLPPFREDCTVLIHLGGWGVWFTSVGWRGGRKWGGGVGVISEMCAGESRRHYAN